MTESSASPPAPTRLRLPPRMRLRRRGDFQRVYREGSRARGASMTVALAVNGLEHARLGLSVGKRCWKSAVKRNRVRRVFREAFRLSLPELPSGCDLVLIGSTPALRPRLDEVRRELVLLARKAHRRQLEKRRAEQAP